jgi:hypothetical protein
MTKQDQEDLRQHYRNQNLEVPEHFVFPTCDHPIEKWCKNCDFDCDTYEKIPHFRKYKELHFLDD